MQLLFQRLQEHSTSDFAFRLYMPEVSSLSSSGYCLASGFCDSGRRFGGDPVQRAGQDVHHKVFVGIGHQGQHRIAVLPSE